MNLFRTLALIFLVTPISLLSQNNREAVKNVADCYGNSFITHPGNYALQFVGKVGDEVDLSAYPSLTNIKLNNTFWVSFIAPHKGVFMFSGLAEEGEMDVLIFSPREGYGDLGRWNNTYICEDIKAGTAVIERKLHVNGAEAFGLNKAPNEQFLYGINMVQGQEISILFNSSSKKRIKNSLYITFETEVSETSVEAMKRTVDICKGKKQARLSIYLRDKTTGLPVEGKVLVNSSKSLNGFYEGTDFLFPIHQRESINLNIDAFGYFFQDQDIFVEEGKSHEAILWLEPATSGKKIELQDIQFKMGSNELTQSAEEKLVRLKDFLLLNSNVHIEIEGHVHEVGESTSAGRRMSASRAKTVLRYLVESGVDKRRLKAVGYGNEFMVYPEPKFNWQEQANRRVEIKVVSND